MKDAFWDGVVAEATRKKVITKKPSTSSKTHDRRHHPTKNQLDQKRIYIPTHDPSSVIYLTQREADCVIQLLQGKTMRDIGQALHLSPRTIEFYINNVKVKLKCRTKTAVIRIITRAFIDRMPSSHLPLRKPKTVRKTSHNKTTPKLIAYHEEGQ